eukprot:c18365_g1_i1 orf=657-2195(-)
MAGATGYAIECRNGNECKSEVISPLCSREGTANRDEAFSFPFRSCRSGDEFSHHSQYIDMDLLMPTEWQMLPGARRPQRSWDSQEFEFSMSSIVPDLFEPVQVAPADELFFKGQLLPLQPDPRLRLVQTLSSPKREYIDGKELSHKRHPFSLDEGEVKFSSCRLDSAALDRVLADSHCSSFRSQNSGYWESSERETRDSSSSRDSNGSYGDSCSSGEKETSTSCGQRQDHTAKSQDLNFRTESRRLNRFNLKAVIHGLKKASKVWVDDRAESLATHRVVSDHFMVKRHAFPSSLRTGAHSSSRSAPSSRGTSFRLQRENSIGSHRQEEAASFSEGSNPAGMFQAVRDKLVNDQGSKVQWSSTFTALGRPAERIKHRSLREGWQRYLRKLKPLYLRISHKYGEGSFFGQLRMDNCGAAALMDGISPFIKPPLDRKQLYSNFDSAHSSRNLTVMSCPASTPSSANHSGVLAVVNSDSSRQELQSAIQGAIAHCKQSQAAGSEVIRPSSCGSSSV